MQLTTPELKEYDTVFPGENWFFYWKTSPSLWESKLQEYRSISPVFVPVYWGLHCESPEEFDFGSHRPETDLKRLFQIADKCGVSIVLVLPVTPCPFFINGGVPSFVARSLVIGEDGRVLSVVDNGKRLNKFFSFYDPRVFQSFRFFVEALGQFLAENGFTKEIFAGNFGYLKESSRFISYFEDNSQAFNKGYHRYLSELENSSPHEIEELLSNPLHDKKLKTDYKNLIESLYRDLCEEIIPASWAGTLRFACLGGNPEDVFSRSYDNWDNEAHFIKPLFEVVVSDILPVSVLLSPQEKTSVLKRALSDVISQNFIKNHLSSELYEDDLYKGYEPQVLFKVYVSEINKAFEFSSLKYFFDREFQWMYRLYEKSFEYTQDYEDIQKIHFFYGDSLTEKDFNQILKLFLNGGRAFLDIYGFDDTLSKKLNLFLVENSIETESINFVCPLIKASLGDGLIILYDSSKVINQGLMKKIKFWETMIKFLKIKSCGLDIDEGLMYIWKHRISNTYELNYEEIRRISIYNPTSYKKKASIRSNVNYAFLKTLDQTNVEVNSNPIGIDLDLLPGGSVSIDFGYFE